MCSKHAAPPIFLLKKNLHWYGDSLMAVTIFFIDSYYGIEVKLKHSSFYCILTPALAVLNC